MRTVSIFTCFLFHMLYGHVLDWSIISTENEPTAFVDGKVNAITGQWTPVIEDLVIQGAEPIHLRRTWNNGDWAIDSSLHVEWDKVGKIHYFTLTETSGAKYDYSISILFRPRFRSDAKSRIYSVGDRRSNTEWHKRAK